MVKTLKISRLAALAMALGVLLAGCTTATDETVRLVSPAAAAELLADTADPEIVLDVRTPDEYNEGHLADAVLIDFYEADFRDQLAELDRDANYVLYCRSGNRSAEAATLMEELGFSSVDEVDGGIVEWLEAGLPIEAP